MQSWPVLYSAPDHGRFGQRLDVGVGEHDERGLPSELEVDPLQGVGRGLHHLLPGAGGPGEGDHAEARVLDQGLAGIVAARDHVEDTVGDPRFRCQLTEHESGAWRSRSWFEDRGAPGGQRRSHLPDRHQERVVPRCDLTDRPHRLPAQHRGVAGGEVTGCSPGDVPGGRRKEPEVVDAEGEIGAESDLGVGLSGVLGLRPGEVLGSLLEEIGELVDHLGPLAGSGPGPATVEEGSARRLDRGVDVIRRGVHHLVEDLAGSGVLHLQRCPSVARGPLAVDPKVPCHLECSCLLSSPRPAARSAGRG